MNVLIVKIGALGDVLRTTFLARALKKHYPDCIISWVTARKALSLLQGNPDIDSCIAIEENQILSEEFDRVISLDDEKEPARIASAVKSKKISGAFLKDNEVVYTQDSACWFGMGLLRPDEIGGLEKANELKRKNEKTYFFLISKAVGIPYNKEKPRLELTEKEKEEASNLAQKQGINLSSKIVGINTGSGKRWPSKRWAQKHTAKLADMLAVQGYTVLLLGGRDEKERNKQIISQCREKIYDFGTDLSLRQFSAVINLCDVVVCTDTLAIHIATALSKNIVALFGPTSAAEIDVFGKGIKIAADNKHCFYKPVCPEGKPCMETISIQTVYEAVCSLMQNEQKE